MLGTTQAPPYLPLRHIIVKQALQSPEHRPVVTF